MKAKALLIVLRLFCNLLCLQSAEEVFCLLFHRFFSSIFFLQGQVFVCFCFRGRSISKSRKFAKSWTIPIPDMQISLKQLDLSLKQLDLSLTVRYLSHSQISLSALKTNYLPTSLTVRSLTQLALSLLDLSLSHSQISLTVRYRSLSHSQISLSHS